MANALTVLLSIKSTFLIPTIPKLYNFKFDLNSMIGRVALAASGYITEVLLISDEILIISNRFYNACLSIINRS